MACTAAGVVRRKRHHEGGLDLPAALLPAAVHRDPNGWKAARHEWARSHDWGAQMLGHLAFFDETLYWHRTALGLEPPMGCVGRYEPVLRASAGSSEAVWKKAHE